MEPLDLIAAKLVLGYLRSAKCKIAHKEFLKTSSHLRHLDYSKTKYMPTRFLGQTLEDILAEYFQISQIIQGRLEVTNFYNENHSKTSVPEQLLYLLNNKVPLSRASTPVASTPYGSSGNYMSPNHSDLEATPVHTLPGNAESEESFNLNASPNRKLTSRSERHSPSPPRVSPIEKSQTEVFDTEVLAQNLMDNKEFQEKIAQTINKVVERQYKERNSEELDKTVKCAVEEAQADPIFEDLLREIMGSSNILEASKHSELVNTTTSSKEKKKDSSDIDSSGLNNKSEQVQSDNQNLNVSQPVRPDNKELPQMPITMLQPIMTYDNTFDNYVISNNCNLVSSNTCVPNSVFINTMTGLLIPSVTTTTVNSTKPLILLNKPAPATVPMALTEHDIMKMPIILNENNGVTPAAEETGQQNIGTKKAKIILPQPTIQLAPEVSDDLKNYFKNYAPPENPTVGKEIEASASSLVPTEITSKKKTGLKKVIYPKGRRKSPRPMKKAIPTSQPKKTDLVQSTEAVRTESEQNKNQDVIGGSNSTEKIVTPVPSVNVKKPTPKSSSHVRNLDFSTPPKSRRKSDELTTQKTQAVKTLFNKAWDADLRAVIPEQDNKDVASKKQQTSNGSKKTRKKIKTNNSNAVTEKEGLLLEAAIKTPIKHTGTNTENILDTECLDDDNKILKSQVKTILSPSKLHNISKNILETKSDETNKFVTPDMPKENVIQQVTANRNITPMLETPIKIQLPKTPGLSTSIDLNMGNISTTTPFTKMLEANLDLKGIDIDSLPTPNLPITPSFAPFTPTVDLISPYSNRPTDYSTGSSYYQPSDNEQNKNLEAHLREIEKASTEVTLNEHLQNFNKNLIGKKNLNLLKTNMEETYSFDSSSNEEESSLDECNKESNDTVIFKKKNDTPRRTYPLRNRTKSVEQSHSPKIPIKSKTSVKVVKVSKKELKKSTETENISVTTTKVEDIATILHESIESEPTVKGVTPSQLSVLKDLENKRLRMVNSLKPPVPNIKIKKTPNSKFKIKPIAKVFTTKKNRKSDSPKKKKKIRDIDIVLKDLITSDDSDVNISLSEEENKIENKLLNVDKGDKTASDVEAQNLIEGLKERGIHLMHNKSPKKKNVNGDIELNTSGTQLEMFDRDSFDMVNIDECILITYNEEESKSKKAASENMKNIEYIGQLYLESIGGEIEIRLKQTNFYTLIDIESNDKHKLPSINTKDNQNKSSDTKKKRQRSDENETNGLKKESKSKSKNETIPTKMKQAESAQCSIKLNEKQINEYKKIQHQDSKNETKSKKTELSGNKKEKHIKDVKKKKDVDNKPKQLLDKHPLKNTTDPVDKSYQKHSSMIDKPSPENRKEIKKQNCTEVKQMSEHKKTKQKSKEKQTIGIKKDEQVPESKTQLLDERAEKKTSENEKIKQDRMIENKDRAAGIKSIFSPYLSDKDSNQSGVDRDIEDELMNFASTGKDQNDVSSKSVSKKRRLSDESLTEHSCKKMLKTLDVDSFLNRIHADTSIGSRK